MKSLTFSALMLAAALAAQPALAAGKTATMQASFTVVESCAVDSGSKQPVVRCQFASPSSVDLQAAQAAAEPAPALQQSAVEAGQSKVWTVTF